MQPARSAAGTAATLRIAAQQLAAAGVASSRVDAELLMAHLLGRSRTQLLLDDRLSEEQATAFQEWIRRRAAGEPVQHLTGTAPFRHLDLRVGPGVFIPRPETELIVELAGPELARATTVVDLCSGSGAIALSVQQEYPSARVIAVERSVQALAWLRRNAEERARAGDRPIEVIAADIAAPDLLGELTGLTDVLLCNPPYVPERIRPELGREVGYDPAEALFAGADGLALMPLVLAAAARLLRPGGVLVIEHDASHSERVPAMLRKSGQWGSVSDRADLTGRPRFVRAVRA